MIASGIVAEVQRLLAEGALSQRKIARLTGVSRGTVGAIASGKRPDYESMRQARDDSWDEPTGPPERCPGCGGMVYMPCRLCRARQKHNEISRLARADRAIQIEEPLELNLRPEHRSRYEEVHAWRLERGDMEGDGEDLQLHWTASGAAVRRPAGVLVAVNTVE